MMEHSCETRLYLDDPDRLEFEARIVERRPLPDGGVALLLDRTCFYPTSGGQPHDTGRIEGEPVVDVREDEAGCVVHHVTRDPGVDQVHAVVDRERRRDHMQQHSGQHLLSATCVELLQRETVSFHLGAERCSIDLPGALLQAEELDAVERRANEVVWQGRSVRVRSLAPDDWKLLRKPPPPGVGSVRVVEIEAWDRSPCCGTHVGNTSEIGLIKLLAQERVRESMRLHFVCGHRALREFSRRLERQEEVVRELTCHPDEVASRVARLKEDARAWRKEAESLRAEFAASRVREWLASATRIAGHAVVVRELQASEASTLQMVAEAVRAQGGIALLGAAGEKAHLLFACPEELALDLRPALKAACTHVQGRGGGPPHRVQGAGQEVQNLDAALAAARAVVTEQLGSFDKGASTA
ncbi:MAG: phosphoesterase [Candidatus Latescibacterota bacterium]|nr:MAG: phosphoesterase [Candidatus Latescibacterota bacterium]